MDKLTITEVAQLAGVSIGTVSRALNDRVGVSLETKNAVLKIVQQTGFVPDVGARRLARGTRQLIGIAPFNYNTLRNPYFAYLLDAIQDSLFERGYVARVIDPSETELVAQCAGFIVPGVHLDNAELRGLRQNGLPVAVIGHVSGEFSGDVPWVNIDNHNGMRAVVEHLLQLGHKKIAHLSGSPIGQTTQYRLDAYRQSLETHGIAFEPSLVLDGGFTEMGAYRALRAEFKKIGAQNFHKKITAIAAASDEMAMGAIHALNDLGYKVPTDFSVTGFDDLPFARYFSPPLTTVRQPIREVGHAVAEMLLAKLETGKNNFVGPNNNQIILPTELIVRASTGPAKP